MNAPDVVFRAGHTLLPHAPMGAVSIEVFNFGQGDPYSHRLYRNIARASGHYYLRHVIRNASAVHRKSPYGHALNDSVTYHYADVELSAQDFDTLVDTAVHILAMRNGKPYYDQREIAWFPPVL